MKNNINILKNHGKSFYWAGKLLPNFYLERCSELYSFCRKLDDIADKSSNLKNLKFLTLTLKYIKEDNYKSLEKNKIFVPSFLKGNKTAKTQIVNLLKGLISDQKLVRIQDEKKLIIYCYQVAGTVGILMCIALDCNNKDAYNFAIDLGIAMQLTNIARDLLEDAKLDRRYVPGNFLENLSPKKIVLLSKNKNKQDNKKLTNSLQKILNMSELYYESGNRGLSYLSPKIQISIRISSDIYREIGNKLKKNGFKWYNGRVFTTRFEKIKLTLLSFFKIIFNKNRILPIHDRELHKYLKEIL